MKNEETIFNEALLKTSPQERAAFIAEVCDGDVDLRLEVEALLEAHEQRGGLLESPPAGVEPTADASDLAGDPSERVGAVVGHYKLLQQIGEGGMGVVFMAEQLEPVRRRVAVKIIKPGLDTRQVIARFEAERQALAMMDHPNIAKVLDAGATDAGRPYFVMELVKGVPITEYCDQQQLNPRERLALFVQVCHAVQHAHTKGIIHRDLKPTNVLVTLNDGHAAPKIIDFGIAKATAGERLTDRTLFTEFRQLVGTPLYMSPEQAEMSAVMDVDTRSDVYSLGVLLYELLTGTTPFDKQRLAKAAFEEVRRILREEEPPRLSTRLSTLGETLATISASRSSDPKRLGQLMRGELDWIAMKALEKDRERRYGTPSDLARDVERYLADQPVEACPPARFYRFRTMVRRNKAAITTAAVFCTVLLLATVISTSQAMRASQATAAAKIDRDRAVAAKGLAEEEQRHAQNSAAMLRLQKGNAFLALGKLGQAEDQFEKAHAELTQFGGDAWIADLGLWDLSRQSNPPIIEWPLGSRRIVGTRFLRDGSTAIVLQEDGTLVRIEIPYGRVSKAGRIQSTCVKLVLSGDERQAFICDDARSLYAWSLDDKPASLVQRGVGTLLAVDETGERTMHAVGDGIVIRNKNGSLARYSIPGDAESGAFLADGRFITAGSKGSGLKLWQAGKFKELAATGVEFYRACAISPDGKQAAVSTWTDAIQIYDLDDGLLKRTLTGHTGRISDLAWSTDEKMIFSASWDGSARAWNTQTGTALRTFRGSRQPQQSIAASPDGYRVLAGGWEGTLRLWDIRPVPAAIEFQCLKGARWEKSFALLCDNRLLAAGEATLPTELYDRLTGIRLCDLGANSRTSGIHRGASQTELIYGSFDGTDVIYDVGHQKTVATLGEPRHGPELQTYSWRAADAPIALIWRRNKDLTAWNLATRKPIRTLATEHTNWQVSISPDGRFAMAFGDIVPLGIVLYSIDSAATLKQPNWGEGGASVFSSDGQFLLTRRYQVEAFASIWRTKDLTLDRTIPDDESVFSRDRFWPDDQHLLSTTQSTEQVLRDAQTGEVLYTVSGLGSIRCNPTPELWVFDRGFDRGSTIADLQWPNRRRKLLRPAHEALEKIVSGGEGADSLQTLGQWFALHGVDDWAADLLTRARQRGAKVDAEELAACYARMGDSASAAKEYLNAIASTNSTPQIAYLRLCAKHHQNGGRGTRLDADQP